MGCKADFAVSIVKLGTAIDKKFNAANRPVPNCGGLSRTVRSYAEGPLLSNLIQKARKTGGDSAGGGNSAGFDGFMMTVFAIS